jgi:tetratricopeptide (TPR) repeat protein
MSRISGNNKNGIYNTTLTLDSVNNSYAFNIWYNDSAGNNNKSINQTFQANWDCTWNITYTGLAGSQAHGFSENKVIGEVTINNTGDSAYSNNNCTITFTNTQDYNFTSSYWVAMASTSGVTAALSFSSSKQVTAGNSSSFNVSAGFPLVSSALEERPGLILTSSITDSETGLSSKTLRIEMTVAQPGAYLRTPVISEYPSSTLFLTSQNLTFKAYTENMGGDGSVNYTAYNVSLNWSLPSSLSIREGNQTLIFSSIANNSEYNYNNITIELNRANLPSMTNGSYSVYSSAKGYSNSTGNLSLIQHANNATILTSSYSFNLLCYGVDDDICVTSCTCSRDPDCCSTGTTSSSGGGGGGGGGAATPKLEKSEASFELLRGEKQEFELEIKNKYDSLMKNIVISVSGINSEYIELKESSIASLGAKESKNITVRIKAPAYFTSRKYNLIFEIKSKLYFNETSQENEIIEKKLVSLYVVEIPKKEIDSMILDVSAMITKMNLSSMKLEEVNSLSNEMNKYYNEIDYNNVKKLYEEIKKIYTSAFEAKKLLAELKEKIEKSKKEGIKVTETERLLLLGETIYARGDYSLALERLKQALSSYSYEIKGEFNLAYTIKNHPLQSLGILLGLTFLGSGSGLLIRLQLLKRKLRMLKEEEILLLELMKVVQRECFENARMSMEEYDQAMYQYENKLSEVVENKIRTETKIANLLKMKGKRIALNEEKKRLIEMMKKIQDDYLNKGKLETKVYSNMMRSYTSRLSEVEEEIASIEAGEALRKSGQSRRDLDLGDEEAKEKSREENEEKEIKKEEKETTQESKKIKIRRKRRK